MYLLGLSEGSWVGIGLAILTLLTPLMGVLLRAKQKADNADTMKTVDEKIVEDLKPVIKMIDDNELDFKEFKKDQFNPLKDDVVDIKSEQKVMKNILATIKESLERNHQETMTLMKDKDTKVTNNLHKIYDKLDTKADK